MTTWLFVAAGYLLCAGVWTGYLLVGRRRGHGSEGAAE